MMDKIEEQVSELSSGQENREKVKALSAEIVVHGTTEKPYYEIEYFDLSDGQYHTGYSSDDLKNVFRWREECFEIVKEIESDIIGEQVKELRVLANIPDIDAGGLYDLNDKLQKAADTIESLSAQLQAADMEWSAEDCTGWIPCKNRLPEKDETVLIDTGIGYFEIATYSGDGKTFYTEECGSSQPVAWQPLPEPYHEP